MGTGWLKRAGALLVVLGATAPLAAAQDGDLDRPRRSFSELGRNEVDFRFIGGFGRGVSTRQVFRTSEPCVNGSARATVAGASLRYLRLFSGLDDAEIRIGAIAEAMSVESFGGRRGANPDAYSYRSTQGWFLAGGAFRVVPFLSRFHFQLDLGLGLATMKTKAKFDPSLLLGTCPTTAVVRSGSTSETLAAVHGGLELGIRFSPMRRDAGLRVGLRLRLDYWLTFGSSRLRLDGDALDSARIDPRAWTGSLGLAFEF